MEELVKPLTIISPAPVADLGADLGAALDTYLDADLDSTGGDYWPTCRLYMATRDYILQEIPSLHAQANVITLHALILCKLEGVDYFKTVKDTQTVLANGINIARLYRGGKRIKQFQIRIMKEMVRYSTSNPKFVKLTDQDIQVMYLHYIKKRSPEQIMRKLKISEDALSASYSRILNFFSAIYAGVLKLERLDRLEKEGKKEAV